MPAGSRKTSETRRPTNDEMLTQILRNQLTAFVSHVDCYESLARRRIDERILETRQLLGKDDIK